jgi:multidrug transporter EmrE-like cation transporter
MRGLSFALVLGGVLLNAAAQLLLKAGASGLSNVALTLANAPLIAQRIIFSPPIWGGLVCYGISVVLWIVALTRVDVSVAYPMLSIGYVVTAVAAWWLFGEQLSVTRLCGIGAVIVGVWLIVRSGAHST